MPRQMPRPERAAEIANEQIKLRVKRAVTQIRSSGGIGFQENPPPAEKLAYYRSKLYPGGTFNAQAALELGSRIGIERLLKEVVPALEQDFFQGPVEKDDASQERQKPEDDQREYPY